MQVSDKNGKSLSSRLQQITAELQESNLLAGAGDCDPRVLSEFRIAVDNVRQTAWAVQQWTDLQRQSRDPYSVLDVLTKERVRRATQLANDLTMDLESLDLKLETEGLSELFHAVERLHERLAPLFAKTSI
jgi:hypothetical protein